jgi:hypothetical protein
MRWWIDRLWETSIDFSLLPNKTVWISILRISIRGSTFPIGAYLRAITCSIYFNIRTTSLRKAIGGAKRFPAAKTPPWLEFAGLSAHGCLWHRPAASEVDRAPRSVIVRHRAQKYSTLSRWSNRIAHEHRSVGSNQGINLVKRIGAHSFAFVPEQPCSPHPSEAVHYVRPVGIPAGRIFFDLSIAHINAIVLIALKRS